MSIEEQLMRERQRIVAHGITSYQYNDSNKQFLAAMGNDLNVIDVKQSIEQPIVTKTTAGTFDPKFSCDGKFIAYIQNGDIWVNDVDNSKSTRLTFSSEKKFVSSGESKFVYSEEFSRYTGYWWRPVVDTNQSDGTKTYSIFYFEESEEEVRDFYIEQYGYKGQVTHYKYPLAGDKNSTIKPAIVTFSVNSSKENYSTSSQVRYLYPMENQYQWAEYYVRGGWMPNGHSVYVELLDRKQQHLALVVGSYEGIVNGPEGKPMEYQTLIEETSNYWINVRDQLHFLKKSNALVWGSEQSGYNHLYLVSWEGGDSNQPSFTNISKRQLTSGDWVVNVDSAWIDETRKLVYFVANKDTPLQNHLYVTSLDTINVVRLTKEGFDHTSIQMSPTFTRFVSNYSNVNTPPTSEIYNLEYSSNSSSSSSYPTAVAYATITNPRILPVPLRSPKLFDFVNSKGVKLYGYYFLPEGYDSAKKYPTIVHVYGGPHVQLVKDHFTQMRQLYSTFGFISVYLDNVGSFDRGIEFEALIKHKMGTVEIQDQVDGVEHLINNQNISIDRSRIAITGWSYGGYLSLMAIAQRPDFFKIAISGAPVTFWEAYNTGYTERYMDTPNNNQIGYKEGSVLNYINNFPNEPNRLIIVHGQQDENVHFANTSMLVEELSTKGKPYILRILGNERHGVRDLNSRVNLECHHINHLLKNL
ncbi:dipeptidylpeptidase 8 [Cavenderia fasciculata]|uniref:Dipeptidylpeptidase 8 n=1 Tax=Cavenderia fasciculata TaxID=261658 RepID=F4Q0S0_CACFS|nr:dipeptidylpeptidase 8 [Cavenderia fasciculata]EGG18421.1 dipeptidylpeptidase 8 [Cavenderia fasciculata]|eukprot:XP_004366325.1 dipeptidylpeptidase 8 [Cavenderia fasciculata]